MEKRKTNPQSVTYLADQQMKALIQKKMFQAEKSVPKAVADQALRAYLEDASLTLTPGFVLRRHLQKTFPEQLLPDTPDLQTRGNVAWDDAVIESLSAFLAQKCIREHGFELRRRDWGKYLRDEQVPQKRKTAFKIMLVTAMDLETALDYLLACTMEPFSAREVLEVILLFCVQEPGAYTWQDVCTMQTRFWEGTDGAAVSDRSAPPMMTVWINSQAKCAHQGRTKEEAMAAMLSAMDHCRDKFRKNQGNDKEALTILLEDGSRVDIKLEGFSMGRYLAFRRMAEYLEVFFNYYPVAAEVDVGKRETENHRNQELTYEDDIPTFGSLAKALLFHSELNGLDWDKRTYNEEKRKSRKKEKSSDAHAVSPEKTDDPFGDEMFAWANTLVERMYGVDRIRTGGNHLKFFRRKDALFFIYFFLWAYQKYLREKKEWELDKVKALFAEDRFDLDRAMDDVCWKLRQLCETPKSTLTVRMNTYRYCFNRLLGALGYTNLYLPSRLDRALLMALLREDTLPILLSKREMEK